MERKLIPAGQGIDCIHCDDYGHLIGLWGEEFLRQARHMTAREAQRVFIDVQDKHYTKTIPVKEIDNG